MVKVLKTYKDCKTIGELRQFLKQINADWMPSDEIPDEQEIPEVSFGGNRDNPELKRDVGKLDLKKILVHLPSNPLLLERWKDHGIDVKLLDFMPSVILDPKTMKPINIKKVVDDEFNTTEDAEK